MSAIQSILQANKKKRDKDASKDENTPHKSLVDRAIKNYNKAPETKHSFWGKK